MVVVSALLAVALVAVVHLLLRQHRAAEQAWEAERRELLNRIQHPDRVPAVDVQPFEVPKPEPDESALVGTISEAAPKDES